MFLIRVSINPLHFAPKKDPGVNVSTKNTLYIFFFLYNSCSCKALDFKKADKKCFGLHHGTRPGSNGTHPDHCWTHPFIPGFWSRSRPEPGIWLKPEPSLWPGSGSKLTFNCLIIHKNYIELNIIRCIF